MGRLGSRLPDVGEPLLIACAETLPLPHLPQFHYPCSAGSYSEPPTPRADNSL